MVLKWAVRASIRKERGFGLAGGGTMRDLDNPSDEGKHTHTVISG